MDCCKALHRLAQLSIIYILKRDEKPKIKLMDCYLYIHAQCPADLDVFNLTTLKEHKNRKYNLNARLLKS